MLIFVLLFNFAAPTYSQASVGGLLLEPFQAFVTVIGDGLLWLLQWCFTGKMTALYSKAEVTNKVTSGNTNTRIN